MGVTTFDTLKFVRRLEQVGVPSEQAEAQAEVLTEAFNVNLEELVTKDYLAAQFAGQKAYVDTKFAEERAHMDKRFAEVYAYVDKSFAEVYAHMDKRFAEVYAHMDKRFAEVYAHMDKRFAEQTAYIDNKVEQINANFKVLFWIMGLVALTTVVPFLERLINL